MALELQHFIYSLYPKQGYGITAASLKLDKQEWKAFCEPPPVELQELQKLLRVWALRKVGTQVVVSLFTPGARDEFNRPGLCSHNILIPSQDYLETGASPIAFTKYFITDPRTVGELPPLTLRAEDLQMKLDFELLAGIKPNTLEKAFGSILKGDTFTLICPRRDTEQMTRLVSALCQLMPPGARIVSFITAPLSRPFRREHSNERYRLKLVQERSLSLWGAEECIDIDQDYEAPLTATPESKSAHYFVDKFRRQGFEGVKTLHAIWEGRKAKNSDSPSGARNFVTAVDVLMEIVSLDGVRQMWKRGEKQEAKRYARVIIDEHKWKNPQELAEIFTMLLEDSFPDFAESDILLLLHETQNLEPSERLNIYDTLIRNLPRTGDKLLSKLIGHYGASFFITIKDLSSYPTISSKLLDISDYDSFKSISEQVLRGALTDLDAFNENLRYIMGRARKQFGEQTLDLVQHLLADFPERKGDIIGQVQIEDMAPNSVISRLPRETRQRLLAIAEKALQILKGVLTL